MNKEILRKIGLTDNEIEIYLALLKHGPCLVSKVVEATDINRTHCYDRMEKLIEKGLASYVIRENRKYFNAAQPKALLKYIDEKRRELDRKEIEVKRILPDLLSIHKPSEKVEVEVFKGREGSKTLLNHVLSENPSTFRVFPWTGLYSKIIPAFYFNWLKRIGRTKIKRRILTSEEKRKHIALKQKNTVVKFLPPEFNIPMSYWVYNDYTIVYIPLEEEVTLIRIKNKEVAGVNKRFFDALWKIAKR